MNEKKEDKNLTIKIETTEGTWENTFDKTAKVQEVISAVVQHFGFAANGKYELRLESDPNTALSLDRPLISYQINDGDTLIFTDLGIAV